MKTQLVFVISLWAVTFLTACSGNESQTENISHSTSSQSEFKIGDIVPQDQVCMVNNAFMGKKQIEVPYNGKTYYGCCAMCEERIPQDKNARIAIDPVSNKNIDKADALIAISGINGEVIYFENNTNYKTFFSKKE